MMPKKTFIEELEQKEQALLSANTVPTEFSYAVHKACEKGFDPYPCPDRVDLREMVIIPIDCDSTKDRDDALSISFDGVYHLGVHIADVAAFVTPHSALDRDAMLRGTSIYLPNMTIPMLPEILSNGLCSLDCADRYAISTLMDIDTDGNLLGYRILKSQIHPAVIGVYSEVNQVLRGSASDAIMEKYRQVYNSLVLLQQLAELLRGKRMQRGADTVNDKSLPHVRFTNGALELIPVEYGIAERIVEEAMVMCNTCTADYFRKHDLPAIFRTQDEVNTLAEYHTAKSYHASLRVDYAHTTSPIRRLADLRMEQVLSAHLLGCNIESLHYLFDELLEESSEIATKRLRRARSIQQACMKFCYREFFRKHPFELFRGRIVGLGSNGKTYIRLNQLNIDVPAFNVSFPTVGTEMMLRVSTMRTNEAYAAYDVKAA